MNSALILGFGKKPEQKLQLITDNIISGMPMLSVVQEILPSRFHIHAQRDQKGQISQGDEYQDHGSPWPAVSSVLFFYRLTSKPPYYTMSKTKQAPTRRDSSMPKATSQPD